MVKVATAIMLGVRFNQTFESTEKPEKELRFFFRKSTS